MSTDLNREQKRQLRKMGALNEQGNPTRARARPRHDAQTKSARACRSTSVKCATEMRKVAWPTWPEVRKYSVVVLITVWSSSPTSVVWTPCWACSPAGCTGPETRARR